MSNDGRPNFFNDNPYPSGKLIQQWISEAPDTAYLIKKAADFEFARCFEYVDFHVSASHARKMREARRPQPRTAVEKAIDVINFAEDPENGLRPGAPVVTLTAQELEIIKEALSCLNQKSTGATHCDT